MKDMLKGNLEFAYPHGDGLLLIGWCSLLHDSEGTVSVILGVNEREERVLLKDCVRYWRPDVANALSANAEEAAAQYGFVATFALTDTTEPVELVGCSLCVKRSQSDSLEADDDVIEAAILVPEKAGIEEIIKSSWAIWYPVLKEASHTLEMYRAFEGLAAQFGQVKQEKNNKVSVAHKAAATALRKASINPLKMELQFCARVSEDALILAGWVVSLDNQRPLTDLRISNAKSAEAVSFFEDISRLSRPDIKELYQLQGQGQEHGFICLIDAFSAADSGVLITASAADGSEVTLRQDVLELSSDPFGLSEMLFKFVSPEGDNMRLLLSKQIGPALQTVWKTYRKLGMLTASFRHIRQFGPEVQNPEVSLIIPLYKRLDFVEYQLSQFALDPFMRQVEIIYVNDDPASQAGLLNYCHANYPIYEVPFKVLHGGKNLGYAGANNLAASVAKADTLLLLNSDVMPKQEGWLEILLGAYKGIPNAGALGVRLLYEDGSIQHDGMRFEAFPFYDDMWICEHPNKGVSSSLLPASRKVREVEALTGACLMVDKERYKQVGGLDKSYILGDFEDSDLCLKLRLKGYRNYLLSDVQLYHLERQSQNLFADHDWKSKLTIFNCWQHTERWDSVIRQLKGVSDARAN